MNESYISITTRISHHFFVCLLQSQDCIRRRWLFNGSSLDAPALTCIAARVVKSIFQSQ